MNIIIDTSIWSLVYGNIMTSDTLAGLSSQERQIFQHFTSIEKSTIRKADIISLLRCNTKAANQILLRLNSIFTWMLKLLGYWNETGIERWKIQKREV